MSLPEEVKEKTSSMKTRLTKLACSPLLYRRRFRIPLEEVLMLSRIWLSGPTPSVWGSGMFGFTETWRGTRCSGGLSLDGGLNSLKDTIAPAFSPRSFQTAQYARTSSYALVASVPPHPLLSVADQPGLPRRLCAAMITSSTSPTLHATPHSSPSSRAQRPHYYDSSYCSRFSPSQPPTRHAPNSAAPRAPKPAPSAHNDAAKSEKSEPPTTRKIEKTQTSMKDAGVQCSPSLPFSEPGRENNSIRKSAPTPVPNSTPPKPDEISPDPTSQSQAAAAISNLSVTGHKRDTPSSPSSSLPDAPDPQIEPKPRPPNASTIATPNKRPRGSSPTVTPMPLDYSFSSLPDLVMIISSMLLELIRHNDSIPLHDNQLTRFHSRAPPGISVRDYLQRLTTHATLSAPILLSMVYYIDRLCALFPAFTINSLTVHRFLIASATVASKGLSDSFWTNKTYAKVGGVSLKELALLEIEFLSRLEWRIVPKPEVLDEYYVSLVGQAGGYEIDSTGKLDAEIEEMREKERQRRDSRISEERERKASEEREKLARERERDEERERLSKEREEAARRESASLTESTASTRRSSADSKKGGSRRSSPEKKTNWGEGWGFIG